MLFFVNDYCEGAHPAILQKLLETNMEKLSGYGTDKYCDSAKEKIRKACGCPDAEVFFLVGGTQTNATIIGSVLNRYEGVLAAQTGHVSCHEAGAIEYTGHKVLTLPAENGKIKAESITDYVETFYGDESHDHMVFPGLSLILVWKMGICGVVLATFISVFIAEYIMKNMIAYKYIFKENVVNFYVNNIKFIIILCIDVLFSWIILKNIVISNIVVWFLVFSSYFIVNLTLIYLLFKLIKEDKFIDRYKFILKRGK